MGKVQEMIHSFNQNADIRKVFEENVLENIVVFQISRLTHKPHKLVNLMKVDRPESLRKIVFKVHFIYTKDWIDDQNYFTVVCEGKEYSCDENEQFYLTLTGSYTPCIEVRLHKVGDDSIACS